MFLLNNKVKGYYIDDEFDNISNCTKMNIIITQIDNLELNNFFIKYPLELISKSTKENDEVLLFNNAFVYNKMSNYFEIPKDALRVNRYLLPTCTKINNRFKISNDIIAIIKDYNSFLYKHLSFLQGYLRYTEEQYGIIQINKMHLSFDKSYFEKDISIMEEDITELEINLSNNTYKILN